jgi:hypothetical protein
VWPRLTIPAAAELGAGVWINIVNPDVAADELRQTTGSSIEPSGR